MSDTTTTTDPFTDEFREGLIAKNETLAEQGDTWLDADPDVAWRAEPGESRLADLRELLIEAGWEKCYHGDARLHFNVKVDGSGIYHGIEDTISDLNRERQERVRGIVNTLHNQDLESFWEWQLDEFLHGKESGWENAQGLDLSPSIKAYSCGRSGGYVNVRELESDGDSMIRLAQFLTRVRDAFNSYEQGKYLATQAIEEDQQRELARLASPRIERIEA